MENTAKLNKIGVAINPTRRQRQLELASGMKIDIIKCWTTLDDTAYNVEQYLHRLYARRRLEGEWFTNISIPDVEYAGYELIECNHDGSDKRIIE